MSTGPDLSQKWQAITTAMGNVGFVISSDGRYEEVIYNSETESLLFDDPAELRGERLTDVLPQSTAEQFMSVISTALETGNPQTIEYVLEVKEDTQWFQGFVAPIPSADGDPEYVLWLANDISERKAHEHALLDGRKRYKSLFENNPLVIWEEDFSAGKRRLDTLKESVDSLESYLEANPDEVRKILELVEIIDVNQNAVEYFGASSKEELLDRFDQIFTDEAFEALRSELVAIANGETRFRMETTSKTLDGQRREELLELHVPEEYADDYSRVYVTAIDISEQKALEQELREKNDRLDEFASVISHDLRNPLNVAQGEASRLQEECESSHTEHLIQALERLEDIVDGTLTLAREGDTVGETESIALPELVTQCWGMVETYDASLEFADEFSIQADPDRVRRVFENLFRNAVEHAGDDVTVTVGRSGTDTFYVEDDGPGIPETVRESVLQPGYSAAPNGTGLGLLIVNRIAVAHGWSVSITDGSRGGARVEFSGVEITP